MPITQARMLALVRAADSAAAKLAALRDICATAAASADAEGALASIATALASPFYSLSANEVEVIVSERVHFRHVEHRNNRTAARMRRNRGKASPNDAAFLALAPEAQQGLSEVDEALDGELALPGVMGHNDID